MSVLMALAQSKPVGETRQRGVLIVDDEPDIRDAVKAILQVALDNTSVFTAEGGAAGLAVLGKEQIDLIVSDYKMPGMNGVEFLSEARRVAPQARSILITAFERELANDLGPSAGAEMVFTKPLDPRPLIKACTRMLDQAEGATA